GALTAALNWYRAMRPPAVRGPVSVPTMYVWSTGDEFIGPVAARAAERFVTAPYRFEVLDGVAHWISAEAPERRAALIVGGVGEGEGGGRALARLTQRAERRPKPETQIGCQGRR